MAQLARYSARPHRSGPEASFLLRRASTGGPVSMVGLHCGHNDEIFFRGKSYVLVAGHWWSVPLLVAGCLPEVESILFLAVFGFFFQRFRGGGDFFN